MARRPRSSSKNNTVVTQYLKCEDRRALEDFISDRVDEAYDVLSVRDARPAGTDPETGDPIPQLGDTGWCYTAYRGPSKVAAPGGISEIPASEGVPVVGKWAGDE